MRIGLIGVGLQGKRRARALRQFQDTQLAVVADVDIDVANALAEEVRCQTTTDWKEVVTRDDIEAVIICSPTYLHASMSIAAMKNGKHVLCEKPLSRTLAEAEEMIRVSRESKVVLKYGCNYRYHRAIRQAKEWVDAGIIGQTNFFRCRHGICGRPGYEEEWRVKPELSGGGHLMEQGIHIVDLFRWFIGEPAQVFGLTATYFWNIAPAEDNAFVLLTTSKNEIGFFQSSLTEWKNIFSLEIFGRDGYIKVEGLGGSYGTEQLVVGKRAFLEPFREESIEYRGEDPSLYEEWKEFIIAIAENREPLENGYDGLEALRIVHAIYESSSKGCVVSLDRQSKKRR